MFGYIYLTTNLKNNKIYIGQHRASQYDTKYIGSGKLLKRAIKKYGKESFDNYVIDTAENQKELDNKEVYYIKKYNSTDIKIGYNIVKGGNGGNVISSLPKESYDELIKKMSANNSGKNNPNYGHGEFIRGENNPAKRLEVRRKISIAVSGEKNGNYGRKYKLPNKKKHPETCVDCGNTFMTHASNRLRCRECELIVQIVKAVNIKTRYKTDHDGICRGCGSEFAKKNKNSSFCNRCKRTSRKIPR